MKEVTTTRYLSFFGKDFDTPELCKENEELEAFKRLAGKFYFHGIDADGIGSELFDYTHVLGEILTGNYASLMTDEERKAHGDHRVNKLGLLIEEVASLKYLVNNPSAWDHYDDKVSAVLARMVALAEYLKERMI